MIDTLDRQAGVKNKLFFAEEIARQDIDVLKRRLREKLGGFVVAIKPILAGARVFRGVRWAERPTDIRQLSYPPAKLVTSMGRLNRIGSPVFYCSAGEPPVFYELKARVGETIGITEWEVLEPLWFHNLGFHEDSLDKLGVPFVGSRPDLTNAIPNETKDNERLRRKISLAFAEEVTVGSEYKYKLSVAINELFFDKAEPIPHREGGPRFNQASGTVYPSVQLNARADNLAVLPEFVDSSLVVRTVKYSLVKEFNPVSKEYNVEILCHTNNFAGSQIIW